MRVAIATQVVAFDTATHSQLCVQTLYGRWGRLTHTRTLAGIKFQYWHTADTAPAATDEIGLVTAVTAADTGPDTTVAAAQEVKLIQ